MSEKIVNGSFTTDLSNWTNNAAYNFVWDGGEAKAISNDDDDEFCEHRIIQSFSVPATCVGATLDVWYRWDVESGGTADGVIYYYVRLKKPDESTALLVSGSKTTSGDGSGWLANGLDVASHFNQVGTYQLWLEIDLKSAYTSPDSYFPSQGWYDNVSLDVEVKYTKTVMEGLSGGEDPTKQVKLETSEGHFFNESYSSVPPPPGAYDAYKLVFEKHNFQESLQASVGVVLPLAKMGMAETLERTYGYRQHDVPEDQHIAMAEALWAKYKVGNFTFNKQVAGLPADIWTDLDKASTDWEQT